MEILTFILGALMGIYLGAYLLYGKLKDSNNSFLDKVLINNLLKDALKEGEGKKSKKGKK
jgi:hypothetical protein